MGERSLANVEKVADFDAGYIVDAFIVVGGVKKTALSDGMALDLWCCISAAEMKASLSSDAAFDKDLGLAPLPLSASSPSHLVRHLDTVG